MRQVFQRFIDFAKIEMFNKFREILMNIHKIRCEKLRISLSDIKLLQNVLKMFKNVDEHLFKF